MLYQRIANARASRPNMRVVLIDPRRTVTADIADLHLPLHSDGDSALFVGLLAYLQREGAADIDFVEQYTTGHQAATMVAEDWDIERVATTTGLCEHNICSVLRVVREHRKDCHGLFARGQSISFRH